MPRAAKHDARGVLAMANKGANTNGYVAFFINDFHVLMQALDHNGT